MKMPGPCLGYHGSSREDGPESRGLDPFSQGAPSLSCFLPQKAPNTFPSLQRKKGGVGKETDICGEPTICSNCPCIVSLRH